MKAKATVEMSDGRYLTTYTTREALADFFRRRKGEIETLLVDINLTRWFYTKGDGWFSASLFRYVPGEPELWRKRGTLKPARRSPFDTPAGW